MTTCPDCKGKGADTPEAALTEALLAAQEAQPDSIEARFPLIRFEQITAKCDGAEDTYATVMDSAIQQRASDLRHMAELLEGMVDHPSKIMEWDEWLLDIARQMRAAL